MIPDSNVIIYWQSTTFSLILRLKIITEMAFKKIEEYDPQATKELAVHYKEVLRLLGEDPEREGLLKTPERVAKSMQFLTQGYHMDGAEILRSAMFKEDYRQMVVVKDIELYSYPQRIYHRAQQDCPRRRVLRPPSSGPGASHRPDTRLHPEHPASSRSGRGHRGLPHVHADPWCPETELNHHDFGVYRWFSQGRAHQK